VADEIDRAQANDAFFLELALRNLNPPHPPFAKVGSPNEVDNPTLKKGGGEAGGICIDCDKPIPEARRRAVPGCTRCINCQTEFERRSP
jgi:phage/conjugal plasmid C-4 type zinc finger TraR family protein